MKAIVFAGNSHSKRLYFAARRCLVKEKYYLKNYAIPGSKAQDIQFPEIVFKEKNIITVVQTTGNDLFARRNLFRGKQDGILHMHKLEFTPPEKIEKIFADLKSILCRIKGKVIFVTNPYRHMCCPDQRKKNLLGYQAAINRKIKQYFADLPNVIVVDHRKVLGKPVSFYSIAPLYASLLPDSVHFSKDIYDNIIRNLEKYF